MLESKLRVSPYIDSHKFGAYEKDATAHNKLFQQVVKVLKLQMIVMEKVHRHQVVLDKLHQI